MKPQAIFLILLLLLPASLLAQTDSTRQLPRNNIRFNLSNRILFGKNNYVLGYERILNEHQSVSLNLGYLGLSPDFRSSSPDLNYERQKRSRGYTATMDYRFYLKRENRYPAPRGVYIGPYAGLFGIHRDDIINVQPEGTGISTVDLHTRARLSNIGFQMGYQFVILKRFTLDLILFGPSLTNYYLGLSVRGDLGGLSEGEFFSQAADIYLDKYPWIEPFLSGTEISTRGKMDIWSFGLRYSIQIGYLF